MKAVLKNPQIIVLKIKRLTGKKQGHEFGELHLEKRLPYAEVLVVESRMPEQMERDIEKKCDGSVEFVSPRVFLDMLDVLLADVGKDISMRECIFEGFPAENEFESMLDHLLIHFVPISMLEAFPNIYNVAKQLTRDWNYRKIYHSAHITELFGLCCALVKPKKTLICDIQHSAVYGSLYCFGFPEFSVYDRFLTWGWKFKGTRYNNVRPVAMNRLPVSGRNDVQKKQKILLATGAPSLNDSGVGWCWDQYVQQQKNFIEGLSVEKRKKLVIRIATTCSSKVEELREWCKKNYPCVKFETTNEKSFSDSLLESELLVCDYWGSSHIEALMLGRPFVMYEGAHVIVRNPSTEDFVIEMERMGIYFKDGKMLAMEISKHEDYGEWLGQIEIQNVYKEYLNVMTGLDKDICEQWIQEFLGD